MRRGGPRTARMRGALAAHLLTLPIAGLPGAAHAPGPIAADDAASWPCISAHADGAPSRVHRST